ncbi:hypothetical protein D3C76_1112440 [compost metagenome]
MAPAQFDDQATLEAFALQQGRQASAGRRVALGICCATRVHQFDAEHQPATPNVAHLREVALQGAQVSDQALAHGSGVFGDVVLRQVTHDRRACGHGHLVAAEGARMGAWLPGIEPVAIDHHGQWQAATDGLGHHHHIRDDAGVLEGEHLAGAGETALDLIDDQGHAGLFSDAAQATQPVQVGGNHAALALHGFDDYRCRQLHAAFRVVEQVLQVMQVGFHPLGAALAERAAVVVRVRHEVHAIAEQGAQGFLWPQAAHQA